MALLRWFTHNIADTDADTHPELKPLDLAVDRENALRLVPETIGLLPRWQVVDVDPRTGTIRATRRSRVWRFVDDITIRLEPVASGTRLHARSRSRVGRGDLGQNRRNLLELFRALRSKMGPK